jgi:hypothetical protein
MKFSVALYVCLLPIMLSAQSTFSNKVYGISLQVPSNYKLHRGELGEDYSLGYLGQYPMFISNERGHSNVVTVHVTK